MELALVAAIAVFVAVVALAYAIFTGGPRSANLEKRIASLRQPASGPQEVGGMIKRTESKVPLLRLVSSSGTLADRWSLDLQRAGSNLRVSEYFLMRVITAGVGGFLGFFLFSGSALAVLIGLVGLFVGLMLPAGYMGFRRGRRLQALNGQLVETLTLLANALRSGFAFTQAVELAAKQLDAPIKDELDHLIRDNALGARAEDALNALAERTGSYDVDMIVTTILVQRTTGGNLSEVLDNVAETIRERERLQGEIKALTASQRFTGTVLSIYPVFLAALFFAIAPSLMSVLWEEEVGRTLLGIAIVLQLLGMYTIRRILALDV